MSGADVLVTGARGKTGREVAAQLAARGVTVRAGSRTPGASDGSFRPVVFDWEAPATWRKAVAGVDAVYLMRPDLVDAPDRVAGLVRLNRKAHVVLLSEQGAETLPDTSWERRVELAVTEAAATWSLLRPSWFHQVLTDPRYYLEAIRDDGVLPMSSGGATIAFVDARDIAAVAVAALADPPDHQGATYTITGPAALPLSAVAEMIASATERPITAIDPPLEQAVAGLAPGMAEIYAGALRLVRAGGCSEVTADVHRVTGAPPRSLDAFTAEHAELWRKKSG
jgi:uncharacterized protein YbjT (DUF2867 family)